MLSLHSLCGLRVILIISACFFMDMSYFGQANVVSSWLQVAGGFRVVGCGWFWVGSCGWFQVVSGGFGWFAVLVVTMPNSIDVGKGIF